MPNSRSRRTKAPPQLPPLPRHQIFLAIAASDRTFHRSTLGTSTASSVVWLGKCIHCQSGLWVSAGGTPGPSVTLEHIVPTSLGGTYARDNLALACARCNQQKGSRLDILGLDHPRLQAVIATLQGRRQSRWRAVPQEFTLSEAAQAWLRETALPDAT